MSRDGWEPVAGVGLDPAVASILQGGGPSPSEPAPGGTKTTPHERERAGRRVTVSFPDEAWVLALQRQAERWGVRVSDVVVVAVAHLMAGVEAGEVRRPGGEVQFYHRGGEGLELEWEPG